MLLILLITTLSTFCANGTNPDAWYQQRDYESVITHYQTQLPMHGSEWVLLGNAYAESNQAAHAIAAWRKAQQINNAVTYCAQKNIVHLKKNLQIKTTRTETLFFWISFFLGRIPLILLQILFLFLCALFAIRRTHRWYATPLLLVMAIYLYILYTLSFSGVILHDTLAHVGPNEHYEPISQLYALQEVRVSRVVNNWYCIEYTRGKYGWITRESLVTYQN